MTVTNPYYEFDPEFTPGSKVRSDSANTQFQSIQNAFDFLPGSSDAITTGTSTFAPESGAVNAYVVTMADTRLSESDGDEVIFFATHTNTGAATLNVDGLGAKAIVRADGNAVTADDLQNGLLYVLRFDASNSRYQLVGPSTSYLTATTAAAVAAAASETNAAASESLAQEWADNAIDTAVTGNPGLYSARHWADGAAQAWAINAEDSTIGATFGGDGATTFSAYHWAQKALGAAGLQRIIGDIPTATPPTTEAVTGLLQYYDADETDLLGEVGFGGSNAFEIVNRMQTGAVEIIATDTGGVERVGLSQDPDASAALYHIDGNRRLITTPQGVGILGNLADPEPPTAGAHDTQLLFLDSAGETEIGEIEWASPGHMTIRNKVHNGNMYLTVQNSAGTERQFLQAQGGGDLYINPASNTYIQRSGISHIEIASGFYLRDSSNERIARIISRAIGGLTVTNEKTGPDLGDAGQRVLTLADWEAGQDRGAFAHSAQTTATDPGSGNFKMSNADYTLATSIYISNTTKGTFDRTTQFSTLAANDLVTIGYTKGPTQLLHTVYRLTGAPTDNTGWWTFPVEYVSGTTSGYEAIVTTDLYIIDITRASAVDLGAYLPLTGGTVTGATTFDNGVVFDDPTNLSDWTIEVDATESYLNLTATDRGYLSEYGVEIQGGGFLNIDSATDDLTSTPAIKADTTTSYLGLKSGGNFLSQFGFYNSSILEISNYIRGGLVEVVTTTAAGASGAQLALDPDGAVSISSDLAVTGAVTGSNLNVSDWDTAFGWGDHDAVGYLDASGGTYPCASAVNFTGGTYTFDAQFNVNLINNTDLILSDELSTDRVTMSMSGTSDIVQLTPFPNATLTYEIGGGFLACEVDCKLVANQASAAAESGFQIVPGVAPTTPSNGDIWVTSSSMFAQINGSTIDLVNVATGTFNVQLNGFTSTPTLTPFYYARAGDVVTISIESARFGTSNTTTLTSDATDLPAAIRPTGTQYCFANVRDNGTDQLGVIALSSSGQITWVADLSSGPFTASGSKGISQTTFTYNLNG